MKRLSNIMALALAVAVSLPTCLWAAGGESHEAHGIPSKALIFAGINFLILLFILGYFLRKPVKDFFTSRAALISQDLTESRQIKDTAAQKFAEYEQRMQGIEAEMQALVATLKEDGQLERDRMVVLANEQAANLQETSKRIMTQELRRAKEDLKQEAVNLAAEMAEDLLKKNITAEDQKRIVDQYISKVEHLS